MRTTIDMPPTLMRAAKARAAERGESLKDLVNRAVAHEVGLPATLRGKTGRVTLPLIARDALRPRRPLRRGSHATPSMLVWSEMKSRNAIIAFAVTIVTLASGCSSGSGGAAPRLPLEKTSIVVAAFPAIDSAGLYIAEMDHLFAAQGLNVTIVPERNPPPSTQDLINGQIAEKYDITAGDYVTYIENETLLGSAYLRIIAEASFLQPNVEALLVKGTSSVR